ncbi:hypothetical protein PTTG_25476 [Puccinia triticina 1-1 BBBD Race 1]|uniref:NAM-associated domain-containing protein n=1 Tax=Puccinia triticina (isolate 1-1 / race 1 (BBBD)) TaxID=630390 RepID=A0A180H2G2_PUCT1|nr:hypothetical protein PTTG_25476 [Puccinia triticina 1-1 BBBD Race 1]
MADSPPPPQIEALLIRHPRKREDQTGSLVRKSSSPSLGSTSANNPSLPTISRVRPFFARSRVTSTPIPSAILQVGSGSSPDNWLQEAMKNYQAQNKNVAFNCLSAWQKLRFALKWRSDQRPDQPSTPLHPNALPDPNEPDLSPSTGITPSARSATLIDRPIGGKAAKQRHIKGYKHDKAIAQANELTEIAQERLGAFQKGNEILIAKNNIEREKLKIEEEKLVLEKEKVTIKKEFCRSKTQMNDYKLLRESEDIDNEDTKEVLIIMKQEIKSKWRSWA